MIDYEGLPVYLPENGCDANFVSRLSDLSDDKSHSLPTDPFLPAMAAPST